MDSTLGIFNQGIQSAVLIWGSPEELDGMFTPGGNENLEGFQMVDNKFKIKAFFEEFDFLYKIADLERIERVEVKRIDRDFLNKVPKYIGATGSMVDISNSEAIFLLDSEGNIVAEPRPTVDITHNEAYQDDEYEQGERVGDALASLEEDAVNSIQYALLIHTGYRIRDHESMGGYKIVVYKPPKGFTLIQWMKEQKELEKKLLSAKIAEIDNI